jgi:hypothetical protein
VFFHRPILKAYCGLGGEYSEYILTIYKKDICDC